MEMKQPDATMEENNPKEIINADHNRLAPAQTMSEEEYLDAEKKLKRKLDLRLMTTVWFIFVLNYLDRVGAQYVMPQSILMINTEQHRCREGRGYSQNASLGLDTICHSSRNLVRWLCSHANPFEYLPGIDQKAVALPASGNGDLGSHLASNWLRAERCRTLRDSFLPGIR